MPFQVNESKDVEAFISEHLMSSIHDVALKLSKRKDLPMEYILQQINGRKKQPYKFPFLKNYPDFIYPSSRALSQASSESTACFKANLVQGNRMLDLTGGMGIDSYFFAQHFSTVDYIEKNEVLCHQAKKNFEALNIDNIRCLNEDAFQFLENETTGYDAIYIDPDRRELKSKGVQIEDCSPNMIEILPKLWTVSRNILVKFSPLLDISEGIKKLSDVEHVYIIADKNEVKEVLFQMTRGHASEPLIHAIDIGQKMKYTFQASSEKRMNIDYCDPQEYLYEGNAALMKAGAFKSLSNSFNICKIAPQTHLYTADKLIEGFPGRKLIIDTVSKPKKQDVSAASIVCRNYPLSADQLRAKFKIREDSKRFLYACKLKDSSLCWITATML